MSQQELLGRIIDTLSAIGVPYMVTGSVASSLHGEPRSTHDIDLVVSFPPGTVPKLLEAFPPPSFYLSEAAIRDAMRSNSMFNLLSLDDGEKIDFWLLKDEPFDQSRFARRRLETANGVSMHVATPEDTILAKLRWSRLCGGSEKQMNDSLRVFEVQSAVMDLDYLRHWASVLGVADLLDQIFARAKEVE